MGQLEASEISDNTVNDLDIFLNTVRRIITICTTPIFILGQRFL